MKNNQSDENDEVIKSLGHNALVTLLLNNDNYHDENVEHAEHAENSVGSDISSHKKRKNEIDIFEANESIVNDLYDYKKNEIYFSPNNINKYSEEKFYENEVDLLHYNNMHINSSIKTELVKNNNYFKNLKKYNFLLKKKKYNTNFSIPHNFNMYNKFLASASKSISRFTNKSEKNLFYLPLSKKKQNEIRNIEQNELVDSSLHSNHFQIEWENKKGDEKNPSRDVSITSETLKNKNIGNTNEERNGEIELVGKNSCNRSKHNAENADIFYSNNISNSPKIERNKCKCCSKKNNYKNYNKNSDKNKLNKKRKFEKVASPTDNAPMIYDKNGCEKKKLKKKVKKKAKRELKNKSEEENRETTIKIENDGGGKNEKPFEHFVLLDFNPKDEDYKAIKKTLETHGLIFDLSFDSNTKKENINTKVEVINRKKCSIKKENNINTTNLEQIVDVGDNFPKYNLLKQKKNTGKIKIVDYDFEKNICYFQ
ncbi:conserved Plasmodium protein, unknown function [Plasmodium chabaudi chabaudi]|uniref:Uncharacterized protein n=1 Tax=Plasmodium chabaudi chabaudi TaxID=31271 RepID=A0A4V0K5K9_PLACU|nr:conserved Plasmodium protein, unknown function [Plasmodium chabaudi chabaudi]VTZ67924.1 conserved Plasmodium protein, unknown function [Plasmodium chabaudi chabaudi]|eukprot:XP_732686.2 conserved Plasmodium protein, unknown function [Plasmodium chabaudi chabaudi]